MTTGGSNEEAALTRIIQSRRRWTIILAVIGGAGAMIAWSLWYDTPSSPTAYAQSALSGTSSTYASGMLQDEKCIFMATPAQVQNCEAQASQSAQSQVSQGLRPHSGFDSTRGTIGIDLGIGLIALAFYTFVTLFALRRRRDLRLVSSISLFVVGAALVVNAASALTAAYHSWSAWDHAAQATARGPGSGLVTSLMQSVSGQILEHSFAPAFGGLIAAIIVLLAAILSLQARTELLPVDKTFQVRGAKAAPVVDLSQLSPSSEPVVEASSESRRAPVYPEPGWYDDPRGEARARRWDGTKWTGIDQGGRGDYDQGGCHDRT